MDLNGLFEKLRNGDRSALGRAITLIESNRKDDRDRAKELLQRCLATATNPLRIGITGIPGVGKSTLIDALGMQLIENGHRVAVLAIDPTSQRSGGSILGDKTRMEGLSNNSNAFIRPTATSGNLGGVAIRTREAIVLCEAAGYDRIIVETVGVGQSELEVDRITDITILLMIAGAGDGLQGIKRGIMETADLIVFTKTDGDGMDRAKAAALELKHALALLPPRDRGDRAKILFTSAINREGIDGLAGAIETIGKENEASGYLKSNRDRQALHWFDQAIIAGSIQRFSEDPSIKEARASLEEQIRSGRKTPIEAAEELLDRFLKRS